MLADMFEWPWRYSGVDGLLCTGFGGPCEDGWCMCQPCPLCELNGHEKPERESLFWLVFEGQYTRAGQWIGPHCQLCDMDMELGRHTSA
jgi:hypothetical protein